MQTLQTLLLVVQVLVALALIGFILIQHGKGADAGAAFGSGASSTVFGAQGSGNFLTKTTTILAFIFLANSLALGYIAKERIAAAKSLMEEPVVTQQAVDKSKTETAPAATTEENTQETGSDVPAMPE
jgi:preprotein translocase subunit SecG